MRWVRAVTLENPHFPGNLIGDFAHRRRLRVQIQPVGVPGVGLVVVDAQIDVRICFPKAAQQLGVGHVGGHHGFGGAVRLGEAFVNVGVLLGNGVAAAEKSPLAQSPQKQAEAGGRADGVPVGGGVAEDDKVLPLPQKGAGLL